jgi:hypothetical protein
MSERRKARRLARLDRKLDRAVELGVMDAEEATAVRTRVQAVDWLMIIEFIMEIMEMIREWLNNRD